MFRACSALATLAHAQYNSNLSLADTIAALLTTVVTVLAMSLGEPKIKVGDKFPTDVIVHQGFAGNTPDAPKTTGTLLSGKKCLVVTLPGAFTPT